VDNLVKKCTVRSPQWIQQSIRNVADDISNHQLLYVTHEDICGSFEGSTLLAIQGPNGTQLEVPRPELSTVPGQKNKYQVRGSMSRSQLLAISTMSGTKLTIFLKKTATYGYFCEQIFGENIFFNCFFQS
jgi:hypothetical protein